MKLKHIYIFIFALIGLLFSIIFLKTNSQGLPVFIISIIYFLLYIAISFRNLLKSAYLESIASFLVGLLFLLIYIKLNYTYYNPVAAVLLIGAAIHVYRKLSFRSDLMLLKRTLLLVSGINAVLLVIPDESILSFLNRNEVLKWKSDLKWDDFEGRTIENQLSDSLKYDAVLAGTFAYKVNKAYNYPPAIIVAGMDRLRSYRKAEILTGHDQLLEHEQGHFNLIQRYEIMATDSVSKLWGCKAVEIDSTIKYFFEQQDKEGSLYDIQTRHGLDSLQQRVWTIKLQPL